MSRSKSKVLRAERPTCLNGATAVVPTDTDAQHELPLLFELLVPQYTDGVMTREEATIVIKATGSGWQASINCPTEECGAKFFFLSLTTLFLDMEKTLAGGNAIWTPDYRTLRKARQAIKKQVQ